MGLLKKIFSTETKDDDECTGHHLGEKTYEDRFKIHVDTPHSDYKYIVMQKYGKSCLHEGCYHGTTGWETKKHIRRLEPEEMIEAIASADENKKIEKDAEFAQHCRENVADEELRQDLIGQTVYNLKQNEKEDN